MSADEPIRVQVHNHRKMWRELWLAMADGDPVIYREIRALDAVKDFWIYFDRWVEKQEAKLKQLKSRK